MEPNGVQIPAVHTERMDITAPLPVPVDELDTELEGPLGTTDEVIFIETEQCVECADGRNGCLATPTVPISSDSISVTDTPACSIIRANAAAHIQPDVPPPTMTIFLIGPLAAASVGARISSASISTHKAVPKRRVFAASSNSRLVGSVRHANSACRPTSANASRASA